MRINISRWMGTAAVMAALVCGGWGGGWGAAHAQTCLHAAESAHLFPTIASPFEQMGMAMALASGADGEVLVVANRADDNAKGTDAGAVTVFTRAPGATVWTEETTLFASDGAANDLFGVSVAVKRLGSTYIVAVGAHQHDTPAGADAGVAYVYSKPVGGSSWTPQATLTASDAAAGDFFGVAVAVGSLPTADILVVGAHGDDGPGGVDAGSAYVFRRPVGGGAWTQVAKLVPTDLASQDNFGTAIAIEQEMLIIGAYLQGSDDRGEAYVFEGDGSGSLWTQTTKLNPVGTPGERFGRAVDVHQAADRDTIAVGTEIVTPSPGRAYLFDRPSGGTSWTKRAELKSWIGQNTDIFGYSVALSEFNQRDVLVVGAVVEDSGPGENNGTAYVFHRAHGTTDWNNGPRITASDAQSLDAFAWVVDVDGSTVVCSSPGDDTAAGVNAGSVYIDDLSECYPDCDCNGTLSIDDFICFQTFFAIGDPYADCDGDTAPTIDDFICFQTFFAIGC